MATHALTPASSTTVPAQGFKAFYQNLCSSANIPKVSTTQMAPGNSKITIMDNYLDLSAVHQQAMNYDATTVYVDVLTISEPVGWELTDQSLTIYARRIQVKAGGTFDLTLNFTTQAKSAVAMLFASEIEGSVRWFGLEDVHVSPEPQVINATSLKSGQIMHYTESATVFSSISLAMGLGAGELDPVFVQYITNSFILGALCIGPQDKLAVSILSWVGSWSGAASSTNDSQLAELFYQSSGLATLVHSQVSARENGAEYVPHISNEVYSKLVKALSDELNQYASDYLTVFSASTVSEGLISTAKALKKTYVNAEEQYNDLLTQAEGNYQGAFQAEQVAETNFQAQQLAVQKAAKKLNEGIAAYKEATALKTAFSIVKGVVEFGTGIAAMAVGQEEGAAGAAEGVEKVAKEAAEASEMVEKTTEAMEQLKKAMEAANKVYELSSTLYEASKGLKQPNNPVNDQGNIGQLPSNGIDINVLAAWDAYKIQADESLKLLVDAPVLHAADYQAAMDQLVVYGKALATAKNAMVQAAQKVSDLKVRRHYAKKNIKDMGDLITSLNSDESNLQTLQQLFYRKQLDAKLLLFSMLQSYRATYYYWALKPSQVNASLTNLDDMVSDLDDAVAMEFDKYNALLGHNEEQPLDITVTLDDPRVIASLQTSGKAQWNMNLHDHNFVNYDRVRFNTLRIWLEGEDLYDPAGGTEVSINIHSSGVYADKLGAQQFLFSSSGFDKMFSYKTSDTSLNAKKSFAAGLFGIIVMDGTAPPDEQNCFFEPTPFSQWSITVDGIDDLSKVQKVSIQFKGSAIPS